MLKHSWGYSSNFLRQKTENTFPCCFLPLTPFTYCRLSIGTATDTVWGQQTEWGGEWGWGGYSTVYSVCFLPCLSTCKQGGGFQMTGHSHLCPVVRTYSPCTAWAGISPPQFGLLCWPVSTDRIYILFGLCVLESPIGAIRPWCCNPVFKVPIFDAFTVATVPLRLNWYPCSWCIGLEKEAQHFKLINPQ